MSISPILLVSMVNFLISLAVIASIIIIPLLSAQLGASDFEVGLVGAAYGGAYLLSSVYSGQQSDRRGRLIFIRIGLLFCAVTFGAQILADQLYTLSLARAAAGLALGMTTAALVTYAFESGSDMGRFSSYGSLGWIAGSLASAWLKNYDYIFAISALSCAAAFLLTMFFRSQSVSKPSQEKITPRLRTVLNQGFPIYMAIFIRHLGAAAVWTILPLYFISIGLNLYWVGMLWGINFAVQFIVMRHLEHFDPGKVFTLGQVLSIAVFLSYVLFRELWPLVLTQIVLGVAWSCLYVGALLLILRSGEERGTASGIFHGTLNLCGAIGPLLGGLIAQNWGYQGVMIFASALGFAGLIFTLPQGKQQRQNDCT